MLGTGKEIVSSPDIADINMNPTFIVAIFARLHLNQHLYSKKFRWETTFDYILFSKTIFFSRLVFDATKNNNQ